jgi:hypothetical protein
VSEPWTDSVARDPRQLEWLATYGRILDNARSLPDWKPPIYLRLPAHFNQHSMEIYSEPNSDFSNYGGWWWREPIGRSQNNVWIVPEVNMLADAAMHIVNLEKPPASERFASELTQGIRDGKRVTMIGFRHDLGAIPIVDRYYADRFSTDADGREFQVLRPTPTSKVLGKTAKGEVWNLMDGRLQINSKEVFPLHGYQPQDLVTGPEKALDPYYGMFDLLGVELLDGGFAYRDGDEWVTVLDAETRGHGDTEIAIPIKHSEKVDARYPDGTPAGKMREGKLAVTLIPQDTSLVRANLPWAPDGIMVDSLAARDSVIIRSNVQRLTSNIQHPTNTQHPTPNTIIIEGEDAVAHNWNYSRMGGMPELSGAACLVLETAVPPPADTGWFSEYRFRVEKPGDYRLRVRENLLSISSPCDWRIDDSPWRHAPNTLVPREIEVVTFYNALEDTRQVFAWYDYGSIRLSAGEHTLTVRVTEPRGRNGLVTMANDRPYAKMIDCVILQPSAASSQPPAINLIQDGSVEFNEDKDEKPDHWLKSEDSDALQWTKPGWSNYKIEGLVDINLGMRDSYTGQRALRIDPSTAERSWNSARLPVKAGQRYELSGYIRSTAPDAVRALIRVVWYDSAGKEVGRAETASVGQCDWTQVDHAVTAPPGSSEAVVSCVVAPGEGGSVRFDEMVFARPME